ncbi:hypothetical protein SBF1_4060004 [Candidatus Desulfosporosinus infrequens]|uniref:Uncharacterized protein n=1 Tax=Candidatus Desulfosporosinus infrequens TaxID=2043169 RepID=A0A2U3L8U3_9FIRM|nr:hypothetical protein SBF1_4060004 [Candidatus Desulfosporosinus infrequens]
MASLDISGQWPVFIQEPHLTKIFNYALNIKYKTPIVNQKILENQYITLKSIDYHYIFVLFFVFLCLN